MFSEFIPAKSRSLLNLNVATAAERRSKGKGMLITWGMAKSPFGKCQVGWADRGICKLTFGESSWGNWAAANFQRDDKAAQAMITEIFNEVSRKTFSLFVGGTDFQLGVWRALMRIPRKGVVSYGQIAAIVGAPAASRAVGTACGDNPIAYLIPCHRVVRASGELNGYRWGLECKRALLEWETGRAWK